MVTTIDPFVGVKTTRLMLQSDLGGVATLLPSSTTQNMLFRLPPTSGAPNQILVTDGNGNLSWSPTITSVTNIAELRGLDPTKYSSVNVLGYYTAGDGGGGEFYPVSSIFAGTYVDNGGTIIVPTGGNGSTAWIRFVSDTLTPNQFGAKGDGVTNDAVAFNKCISVATSTAQTVSLVSKSTYNCTGATLSVTCSIEGNGATIKGYLRVTGDDITLSNFDVIGTNTVMIIFLFGSTTVPTRWARQKLLNLKLTFDTGVATTNSLGINASNIDYLTVSDCFVLYGFQFVDCKNYTLTNNIVDGDNYNNTNELLHASLNSVGIVSNNTFQNSLDNFIDLYTSGAKTVITNNRFLGCKARVGTAFELKVSLTDTSNTSSDANGWEEQIIFSNNYIYNVQAPAAQLTTIMSIFYIDTRAVPIFSWANVPRNIVVSNNIFDTFDTTKLGSNIGVGIYCSTLTAIEISNNIFRGMGFGTNTAFSPQSSAVWIEDCQDVLVCGNKLNFRQASCVTLHRTCQNITISNNHMTEDLKYSWVPAFGIFMGKVGSRPDPTLSNISIIGNTIDATSVSVYQLVLTTGTMSNSILSNNNLLQSAILQKLDNCSLTSNVIGTKTGAGASLTVGSTTTQSQAITICNNTIKAATTAVKGIDIYRTRVANINQNMINTTAQGLTFTGTNVSGELDYLNVKDNFSINQTALAFPSYVSMSVGDTATLQASNNQKV